MGKIEFEIPNELGFIEKVPDIDWSILIKKMLKSKLNRITRFKKIIAKSKLTENDVEEFSDKVNEDLYEKHYKK